MKDLFKELVKNNISLWMEGESLELSFGEQAPSGDLVERLKAQKADIVAFLRQREIHSPEAFNAIDELTHYPLSFAQQRLFFIEQLEQGTDAYHIPMLFHVKPNEDVILLLEALKNVWERHQVLRTVYFTDEQGDACQQVADLTFPLQAIALTNEKNVFAHVREAAALPFDLKSEGPLRIQHISSETEDFIFVNVHHIAFDGWSHGIFTHEWTQHYQSLRAGLNLTLAQPDITYVDYALWQNESLSTTRRDELVKFWKDHLNEAERLELPTDFERPAKPDYIGKDVRWEMPELLASQLRQLAREHETTLNSVLMCGFYTVLSVLTGQENIVLGTALNNREHTQVHDLIGFFVNTLPICVEVKAEETIERLIEKVRDFFLEARLHQDLPFEQLVDAINEPRDPSRHPVYQMLFTLEQGTGQQENLPFEMMDVGGEDALYSPAKFDLSLTVNDTAGTLKVTFNYATALFEESTVERMMRFYEKALLTFVSNKQQKIGEIDFLENEERQLLEGIWRGMEQPYPETESLVSCFEKTAATFPDKVALVDGSRNWTYQALQSEAKVLASHLAEQWMITYGAPFPKGEVIGLYQEQRANLIISMLATLYVGGAYMPLSPTIPAERLRFMIGEAKMKAVLAPVELNAQYKEVFGAEGGPLFVALDQQPSEIICDAVSVDAHDLAYVLFTSGTSGQPKGVCIPHRAVVSLVKENAFLQWSANDVVLQHSNPGFDAATLEIWGPLTNGGTLVMTPTSNMLEAKAVKSLIQHYKVTILWLTRTLFDNLFLADHTCFEDLNYLLVGGEALTPEIMRQLVGQRQRPNHILNGYGPTESTTFTTTYSVASFAGNVPLGKPINTRKVYVLNPLGKMVPIGCPGELHIAGAGLASGYLNQPELTESHFVTNPFASESDLQKGYDRLYKSGDRVRFMPDGNLAFLGRIDSQVKIRGYRIELAEIEQVLLAFDNIQQTAVIPFHHNGVGFLAAYCVPAKEQSIIVNELIQSLAQQLPDYMVPETVMIVEELPLTANGKLNTRALPKPEVIRATYVGPQNKLQEQLCLIWQELLGIERVGIYDDFFAIGGNSILAIKLLTKCRSTLKRDIPLSLLFRHSTIALLSEAITEETCAPINAQGSDIYPLSLAQARMLFLEENADDQRMYQVPYLVKLLPEAKANILESAIEEVVGHHPILTALHIQYTDGGKQLYSDNNVAISHKTVSDVEAMLEDATGFIEKQFDLSTEAPMRVCFYHIMSHQYVLFLWHHIAMDGWSLNIFMDDLAETYTALSKGEEPSFRETEISYGDYAVWQQEQTENGKMDKIIQKWLDHLSGFESLALPLDFSRPKVRNGRGKECKLSLSPAITAQLKELAKQHSASLYSVMLAAYYIMLYKYTGQRDLIVGTPSDNRDHPQTQGLIGFFVNSLPLRYELVADKQIGSIIEDVHQKVSWAKTVQDFPIEKLARQLGEAANSAMNPIFQVLFSLKTADENVENHTNLPLEPVDLISANQLHTPAQYDLSMLLREENEQVIGEFRYATSLFQESSVLRMAHLYTSVLEAMVAQPVITLTQLNVIPEADQNCMLYTWNTTDFPLPKNQLLHSFFEQHAAHQPNDIALVYGDEQITYAALNEKANQLAGTLRNLYAEANGEALAPDTLIAIFQERNISMVISILAVLKAGGAYVPISTTQPKQRVKFMMEDTGAKLLLIEDHQLGDIIMDGWLSDFTNMPQLVVVNDPAIMNQPKENLPLATPDTAAAYVVYTSGTTGTPKGVVIEHQAAVSFVYENSYVPEKAKRVASLSPFSFDGFVFDLFYTLSNKACMHLIDKELALQTEELCTYFVEHQIDTFFTTTALFNQLVGLGKLDSRFLRNVLFGGEKADVAIIRKAQETLKGVHIVHVYGPTEAVVYASRHVFGDALAINAPLGGPLHNKRFYVLDDQQQMVPIGAVGELYIGGAGIAREYLNQPALTAERFIEHSLIPEADISKGYHRLYKTGDIVRWLPNGTIEFLGRVDAQVKIRGHRIELGEVESALRQLPDVANAVVVALQVETSKQLAAYFVPDVAFTSKDFLRDKLAATLPDYMIPTTFTQLEEIPLTLNGKLDKRRLPHPTSDERTQHVAPRNSTEEMLHQIWQEVLHLSDLGVHDNFFHIGGDSIIAIRCIAMAKECGFAFKGQDLFAHPTIAALAEVVEENNKTEQAYEPFQLLEPASQEMVRSEFGELIEDAFPATQLQMGMLLESKLEKGTYHDVIHYHLNVSYDAERFKKLVQQLVDLHEVLRTGFVQDETLGYIAMVAKEAEAQIVVMEGTISEEALIDLEHEKGIAIEEHGLFRFVISNVSTHAFRFSFSFHHAILDGWSEASLASQLITAYLKGLPELEPFPKVPAYGKFVAAEREAMANNKTREFWSKYLQGYETPDFAMVEAAGSNMPAEEEPYYAFSAEDSQTLLTRAAELKVPVDTLFLATFIHALAQFQFTEEVMIGLVVNNRLEETGGDQLCGLFLNTLPFRSNVAGAKNILQWVRHIADSKAEVMQHKALPYAVIKENWLADKDHQYAFNYIHFHNKDEATKLGKKGAENVLGERTGISRINIPLTLSVHRQQDEFELSMLVNSGCIDPFVLSRFWSYFKTGLHQLLLDLDTLQRVHFATVAEGDDLFLLDTNPKELPYPSTSTIHQLVTEIATKNPDKMALCGANHAITYGELDTQSDQLAAELRKAYKSLHAIDMPDGTLVGLFQERSLPMVVAMLAVLKAGGAYLPISPSYPAERIQLLLSDASLSLVVTAASSHQQWKAFNQNTITSIVAEEIFNKGADVPKFLTGQAKSAAYVNYTSGTTGNPKGVVVPHQAVVSLVQNNPFLKVSEGDVFVHLSNPNFDAATLEIWGALTNGCTLSVIEDGTGLTADIIAKRMQEHQVSVMWLTRSLFDALYLELPNMFANLRYLFVGGEALTPALMKRFVKQNLRPKYIVNGYGPTESTTFTTTHEITAFEGAVPLGKPINTRKVYVIGKNNQLAPIGSPGELYIGGAGLALGYLNRDDVTAQKFVDNPFADVTDLEKGYDRLYRSGDVVRWRKDGTLHYLGRTDKQVKLRGYRIEPGEIESALMQLEGVLQVAVTDQRDGSKHFLVAYVVFEDEPLTSEYLLEQLREVIPAYLLPDVVIPVDEMPLNANGKIDLKALPVALPERLTPYTAPQDEREEIMCRIWQQVLQVERVGIHDNFFEIGGNSITAIRLTAAVHREFGCALPLSDLFRYKTVSRLANHLSMDLRIEIPQKRNAVNPLSFAQERLFFIERFEGGSDAYHIPYVAALNADADKAVLVNAIQQVVQQHGILNSIIRESNQGTFVQEELQTELPVQTFSVSDQASFYRMVELEVARPFKLDEEAPLRIKFYESEDTTWLLLLWHHIAFDGWSLSVFMRHLSESYFTLLLEAGHQPKPLEISYGDYASWQREYLKGDNLKHLSNYWSGQLSGWEMLNLPADHPRPAEIDFRGADMPFALDRELSEQLNHIAKTEQTTLYTVLLSAFYVTLSRISGQSDVLIGTPSENRDQVQVQNLVGFFVNTLPLRVQVDAGLSVRALLHQVHQTVIGAKSHQALPFEKLVDLLGGERDPARHPLFQVIFTLQNFNREAKEDIQLPFTELEVEGAMEYTPAKFDLGLGLTQTENGIEGGFNYALSLFNPATIERFIATFKNVLQGFVSDLHQEVGTIEVLSPDEHERLLNICSNNNTEFNSTATLTQLFEERVQQMPDHIALQYGTAQLTYSKLDRKANQLAHKIRETYLAKHGQEMQPGTLIGLYLDRGLEMIVGMLAVHKAGGAYVPISPLYPQERLQYMLFDMDAALLLTNASYSHRLSAWMTSAPQAPTIIEVEAASVSAAPETAPNIARNARDLAYVIYTSGTTGRPKGVMVEHRSVVNLVQIITATHLLGQGTRSLFFSEYVFDASVYEIFPALLSGGRLYIASTEQREDMKALLRLIREHQIKKAFLPTALLDHIAADLAQSGLEVLHTGGDKLNQLQHMPAPLFFNQYGPTEGTVMVTQNQVSNVKDVGIGKPVANSRLFVLDEQRQLAPFGSPGELYIGGIMLARGYLNRKELTAESFVPNPFANANDKALGYDRIYKTGDLVRWLPDGGLEFLGQTDRQVKIRGYRIELSEIEYILKDWDEISNAVVVDVKHNGGRQLAAYCVFEQGKEMSVTAIRNRLAGQVPSYMVPASFNSLTLIPLTINGKVDQRALPAPHFGDDEQYSAPETELQSQLCACWEELLGLERVGIHDNFFHIGGDSIVSIQMVSKLRRMGISIQVKAIFDAPTIMRLARLIEHSNEATVTAEQGVLEGKFDLLPIQQWFFEQKFAKPEHWNQSFHLGVPDAVTASEISEALHQLSLIHDVLRLSFDQGERQVKQTYLDESFAWSGTLPTLPFGHLTAAEKHERLTDLQSNFNLNNDLWTAVLLTGYDDGCHRLFFSFHHLLIDVVSWRIIADDMRRLLSGDRAVSKTSSYRQWVEAVDEYANKNIAEADYWRNVTANVPALPVLETVQKSSLKLSKTETQALLNKAGEGYHTEVNDLLLTALGMALNQSLGIEAPHILMEGHGRESIRKDLAIDQTVGWFTTMYPVQLKSGDEVGANIIGTKEMLRAIPNKGIGFGALAKAGHVQATLPQISFNYLGQLDLQTGEQNQLAWQLLNEDAGIMIAPENHDHLALNINGAVQNGTLSFNITSRLDKPITQDFTDAFAAALRAVIEEALQKAAGGGVMTPSDYNDDDLTMDDLSRLQSKFEKPEAIQPKEEPKKSVRLRI